MEAIRSREYAHVGLVVPALITHVLVNVWMRFYDGVRTGLVPANHTE
jgi:hypothetical protein